MAEAAEMCLTLSLSVSVSVYAPVKVNGVSLEIAAVATGVPTDPVRRHQHCCPYGTAEGVKCTCAIGISSLDCDSVVACVYE